MNKKTLNTVLMGAQLLVLLIVAVQISALTTQINGLNTGSAAPAPTARLVAPTPAPAPSQPQPTQNNFDMAELSDDDPFKGDENAPVTIVEWSDFECPFCSRFYSQTLSQIEEKYINTGKVKLVYRDFPLSFHQNAQKAAEASECADDQGMFWEMHDKIFENQGSMSADNFKVWALELGLDATEFNTCLDSGKHASETQKDMADGSAAGIRGTPGFIINGQLLSGAQPFASFEAAIEAALSK